MKHSIKKQSPFASRLGIFLALVGGAVCIACLLLFCNRKAIATSVKSAFDFRPSLTEATMFETLTTQEITKIEAVVQSAEYLTYTEEKSITDPIEIAGFVQSISAAKLVEEGVSEDDVKLMDCYTFYLDTQEITVYTKQNDASFILIEGMWQEIDTVDEQSFYACYLASTSQVVIYDDIGLVFYPQTWEATETELAEASYGIDVSYHQGVIDWAQVAQDGVDFAMIRVGLRYAESGILEEDPLARYNLQEASKYGIAVGVYFFSTAITEQEVLEEAQLVLEVISGYGITYPVVYDCEMFHDAENRNSVLSNADRSALADLFLSTVEAEGYIGMFYASKNDLAYNAAWETNYLQSEYRIWVAQYPGDENDAVPVGSSSYIGRHEMWQYTSQAEVAGIDTLVDRNVAYFSYSTLAEPKGEAAQEVGVDYDALAKMEEVSDQVTAKELVNVRSAMDSTDASNILGQLSNGEVVTRIGVSANGWSKIEFKGSEGYVMTSLITMDIGYLAPTTSDDGFNTVFETVSESVTAKEVTNLRSMPSVTDENSVVVATLTNGEVVTRTGVSNEGFSRVEYQGQTLYCVSSYLILVE